MTHRLLVAGLVLALSPFMSPSAAHGAPAQPMPHMPALTFTVNLTTDGHDSVPGNGVCYEGVNGCSLRAAIEEASALGGTQTIVFDASLNDATIILQAGFGPINWAGSNITLDGATSNVTVNAASLGLLSGQGVIRISGDSNHLVGLTITGSAWDGIQVGGLAGTGSGNNNFIQFNTILGSAGSGIYVIGDTQGGGSNNQILNNHIGARTSAPVCNDADRNTYGVYVASSASGTRIGNNAIVCNWRDGVSIDGAGGSPHNTLVNINDIGGNHSDLGNGWAGVAVYAGAQGVTLDNNVIIGNDRQGVWLGNTSDITITNSHIGVSATGIAVPNALQGIHMDGTAGAVSNVRINDNVISGNELQGVWVQSSSDIELTTNTVGANDDGTLAVGNGQEGILIQDSTTVDVMAGGLVAYNGAAGVAVTGSSSGNRIYPSAVYANRGLAIDLGNDGFTLNDPGDADAGPNGLLNYAVITQAAGQIITGTACAFCNVAVYRAFRNPAGPGGGYTYYLGGALADGTGRWSYSLPGGSTRWSVTLQACSFSVCAFASDVSELSPRAQVFTPVIRRPA